MNKFFKGVLILLIPLVIIFITYLILDPFNLSHSNFLKTKCMNQQAFEVVKMNHFMEYSSSVTYNSYLFGNSKCNVFKQGEWGKQIGDESKVEMANLGSPGERILHIRNKLKYIEKKGLPIDNVLLILDKKILANSDGKYLYGPVYMHHSLSNGTWKGENIVEGFSYFMNDYYFMKYFTKVAGYDTEDNKIVVLRGTDKPFEKLPTSFETSYYSDFDEDINKDSIGHLNKQMFKEWEYLDWNTEVSKLDRRLLKEIAEIFERNNTNYKIVFGPLYYENKIADKNIEVFKELFDSNRVWDFSGQKKYQNNPMYWYDTDHYRTTISNEILSTIYH